MILEFKNEYRFLSNFYHSPIIWQQRTWPTVEHAYQAAKNLDYADAILQLSTAARAKAKGKTLPIRSDWEAIKLSVMAELVYCKFEQHADLVELLLQTDGLLKEGNYWHDNFWGSCFCQKCQDQGLNMLGKLLMIERDFRK